MWINLTFFIIVMEAINNYSVEILLGIFVVWRNGFWDNIYSGSSFGILVIPDSGFRRKSFRDFSRLKNFLSGKHLGTIFSVDHHQQSFAIQADSDTLTCIKKIFAYTF